MSCPKCGAPGIVHKGFGTKLLESELKTLFPSARIQRFDADNKKGEGLDEVYDEVKAGEVDILVGTQTLAKGLDLPRLATVGVVQADAGLNLPDFTAEGSVTYNWAERIYVGVSADFASERAAFFVVPSYVDLGVSAEYRFDRRTSFWAKGGNLLNQTIQKSLTRAENGVYFTAGICLNF